MNILNICRDISDYAYSYDTPQDGTSIFQKLAVVCQIIPILIDDGFERLLNFREQSKSY